LIEQTASRSIFAARRRPCRRPRSRWRSIERENGNEDEASKDRRTIRENVPSMNQPVLSRTVVVTNPTGLHLRPASLFARCASGFRATIELVKNDERVDGKSVLSITSLGVEPGSTITIIASGEDAQAAVEALVMLIERDFAE
jgi:phosphocarrier protein